MWRMPYTILKNLPILPGVLETMHRMIDRPECYTEQEGYDYVRYIVSLMERTGHIRTVAHGAELLPREGGYVLYPNHQGKFDAYAIVSAHDDPLTVVMDREKSYSPFVSEIIDLLRGKRMELDNARQALTIINQISGEVKEGRRYILFPEGGYSDEKQNALWEFKPGCFKAATKVGAPIIPVALVDSYQVYNSWKLTPVTVHVHFLEPICFEEYKDMSTHQISLLVRQRIEEKLKELGR